jgi:hypothetical protein
VNGAWLVVDKMTVPTSVVVRSKEPVENNPQLDLAGKVLEPYHRA